MIRRVGRHRSTRSANDSAVAGYGARLEMLFSRWVGSGRSGADLAESLQTAAEVAFRPAYLAGKRQALRGANLTTADKHELQTQLDSNRHYLHFSLAAAILARKAVVTAQGGDESKALEASFAARVRLQYGGRLWQVHESGYQAGIRDLGHHVHRRLGAPAVILEDAPSDDSEDDGEGDYTDAELAAGLGLGLAAFLLFLSDHGGATTTFRMGTEYSTEEDDKVCDECQGNRDDGEDGVYWLPDEPPLPGSNCSGGQNCRCFLATVWDS